MTNDKRTALERAEIEHYAAMLRRVTQQRFSEGDYLHTIGPVIAAARAEGADEAIGFTIGYLSSRYPNEEIPAIGDEVRDAWRRAHGTRPRD